jgi:hypothetical protein
MVGTIISATSNALLHRGRIISSEEWGNALIACVQAYPTEENKASATMLCHWALTLEGLLLVFLQSLSATTKFLDKSSQQEASQHEKTGLKD